LTKGHIAGGGFYTGTI